MQPQPTRAVARGLPGLVVVLDREQPTKRQKVTAKTFFAKACEGPKKLLLIVNKNRLSILLLLISNLYSFFFAQKDARTSMV